MSSSQRLAPVFVVPLAMLAVACGGGGGGGSGMGRPSDVKASLSALGVDTTETPRVADQATQEPLPDTYAPFGAARTFDKVDEIVALGFRLDPAVFASDAVFTVLDEQQSATTPGVFTSERLYAPAAAGTPWALSSGAVPAQRREVAAGDVDGDGLEELLVLAWDEGAGAVRLWTVQDKLAGFSSGAKVDVSPARPAGLALAAGDFDGDGRADAVAAVVTASEVQLIFLGSGSGVLQPTGNVIRIAPVATGSALDVVLATGNLDNDRAEELAVVVNERYQANGADAGTSRLLVYDDAGTGHAQVAARTVSASAGGATRAAVAAGIAIGDIDGDNIGEVVVGGLTNFDPGGTCGYAYLLFALDDLAHGLASLGATYQTNLFPPGSTCAALRLRAVHVKAFDRDGDGADEIQVNQLSFEDFRAADPWTPLGDPLPLRRLFGGSGSAYAGEFSRATSAFAVGDVTADKREDLLFTSQLAADGNAVRAWGVTLDTDLASPTAGQEVWRQALSIPAAAAPTEAAWPVLVAANVDQDSMSIGYSPAERRVVFTAPVVIAALAAAPCARDLGQDLDACRTAFGTSTSTGQEIEKTFSLTAGLIVGTAAPSPVWEVEAALTVKANWARKTTTSYTLTKTVTRTTGPLEDAVIFTSIPYDQFTYTILAHPNPALVGSTVVVSLPRTPIETMVERGYFNANVPEGSAQIDDTVFHHTIGVPRSYPTAAQKDQLLAGDPDLFNGPLDVGQGDGSTTAEINQATQSARGTSFGVNGEFEVTTTAPGLKLGLTIGAGFDKSVKVTHGTESFCQGTVSHLSAAKYSTANAYKFGLFTYVHEGPQQPFEVVNYWVQ